MQRLSLLLGALALGLFLVACVSSAEERRKPKYGIKTVMKEVHTGGLLKKVTGGQASKKEKTKLLEYYVALYESKPKKGSEASWNKKSGDLVVAAAKVLLGQADGRGSLKKAVNCKACHSAHK